MCSFCIAKSKEKEKNQTLPKELDLKFANDQNPTFQHNEQNSHTAQQSQENAFHENQALHGAAGMASGQQLNGQELLLQLLASQGNLSNLAQLANAQTTQGANPNLSLENLAQTSTQSLMLLQRIIQNTPEIHVLHQQEQLALYQIQQHIRSALTQNLGQEIVSQLVLEYKKIQEQHQQKIQGAIQRKLTMILCQSNPNLFNAQPQETPQPPPQDENNIEIDIFKHNRGNSDQP